MRALRTRWAVLVLTGLPVFLISLNLLVIAVAFPALERSFPGASPATLAWVLNGHNLVFGALLIPAGSLADSYGRRRVMVLGLVLFAAGSLLCALAPSVAVLVAGRVIQGLASAAVMPASLGLLLAAFEVRERAVAVSAWGGVSSLGAALGPALGAAIVEAAQWRWVFLIYVPLALGGALLARRHLEASAAPGEALPDLVGALLVVAAFGSLASGVSRGPGGVGLVGLGGLLLGALAVRCWRAQVPLVDLALFRIRSFSAATVAVLVFGMAFFGQVLAGILFLTSIWHYGLLAAALAITPTPVTAALVGLVGGQLVGRYGYRAVAVAGNLAYAAGLAWLWLVVTSAPAYLWAWLPAALLMGVGIGGSFSILGAAAVSELPRTHFALGGAVSQTARQLGAVMGVATAVAVLSAAGPHIGFGAYQNWFAVGAGLALASAGLSGLIGRPLPVRSAARREPEGQPAVMS